MILFLLSWARELEWIELDETIEESWDDQVVLTSQAGMTDWPREESPASVTPKCRRDSASALCINCPGGLHLQRHSSKISTKKTRLSKAHFSAALIKISSLYRGCSYKQRQYRAHWSVHDVPRANDTTFLFFFAHPRTRIVPSCLRNMMLLVWLLELFPYHSILELAFIFVLQKAQHQWSSLMLSSWSLLTTGLIE